MSLVEAHELAAAYYRRQLLEHPTGWAARHLTGRRLGAVLEPDNGWSVGYAPDGWSRLSDHLQSAGVDTETLLAAGLAKPTKTGYLFDRFRDRITFVAHDIELRPVGFVARTRHGIPRYLNSPGTSIYSKGRALVGIDAQQDRLARGAIPVVVEGPTDALGISLLDDDWAGVSLCGTAITRHQASMIRRHATTDTVIVMTDGDPAGRSSAVRCVGALATQFENVMVAELPAKHDPAALFGSSPRYLRALLEQPRYGYEFAIDVELSRWAKVLDHVSGQVGALRAVAPLVVKLPADRIAGQVATLSRHLRLEEHVVSREVLACVGRRRFPKGSSAVDFDPDPDLESRTP